MYEYYKVNKWIASLSNSEQERAFLPPFHHMQLVNKQKYSDSDEEIESSTLHDSTDTGIYHIASQM